MIVSSSKSCIGVTFLLYDLHIYLLPVSGFSIFTSIIIFLFYGSIGVSEWSIAHCQGYIWRAPGPLPVFPV